MSAETGQRDTLSATCAGHLETWLQTPGGQVCTVARYQLARSTRHVAGWSNNQLVGLLDCVIESRGWEGGASIACCSRFLPCHTVAHGSEGKLSIPAGGYFRADRGDMAEGWGDRPALERTIVGEEGQIGVDTAG